MMRPSHIDVLRYLQGLPMLTVAWPDVRRWRKVAKQWDKVARWERN